jgi:hypothetical protein
MSTNGTRIDSFAFQPGRVIAGKYVVEGLLGRGWEGEVYRVVESKTGIPRAAKLFYPHRNAHDRRVRLYARKLDRLRRCPIVIQYHHSETIRFRRRPVTCLISELVEGELLARFLARQPRKRLAAFEALHLTHAMACGLEQIHRRRDYHGDVHDKNILIQRRGINFDVKLLDFYHWGPSSAANIAEDVNQLVRILYDAVGGRRHYASQPSQIKRVCCGLKRSLVRRKFPTAAHLRVYLETFDWTEP